MIRTVRKNRSFEQKQKRPNAHQVGKQLQSSSNHKNCELNPLLRTQMLLETNREYRIAEIQQGIGGLLAVLALIYVLVGCLYYFGARAFNSYAFQFVLKMVGLGFLKPSVLDQFHEPTVWVIYKNYSLGQPVIVGIVIIFSLVIGALLSVRGRKKQDMISANTNDDGLRKDYEMVKKKGSVTHD
ncbi:hypothetical protein [Streptococcus agalactiae]|uniref:Uncharacterized protein n=1 Tax=Streptococcus agalactiae MRI Z1-216 TaxID=1154879 RepID=A0AAD3A2V6_STRAG|nr:hypothetical protein [Streptococcus agalactiae]EPU31279.1 hypothetical protein SAG0161_00880 [Streptococcus agalactiae MRI Z1-213]EPU38357.1 hypothetical protein SAG0164_01925 [Streptococcus agalactiae MRI Z1-216]EPU39217.1 hypothetical protein SAG0162_10345 [Streptococcus agalactiae MRI Z1-214]EPX07409.1 hypothetical protein SAG0165_04895 [Streptococcus agalactiae MRI Z1-217]